MKKILFLLLLTSCSFDVSKVKLPYTCWECEVDIFSLTKPREFYVETLCNKTEEEIRLYEENNNYNKDNGEFKCTFCYKIN